MHLWQEFHTSHGALLTLHTELQRRGALPGFPAVGAPLPPCVATRTSGEVV